MSKLCAVLLAFAFLGASAAPLTPQVVETATGLTKIIAVYGIPAMLALSLIANAYQWHLRNKEAARERADVAALHASHNEYRDRKELELREQNKVLGEAFDSLTQSTNRMADAIRYSRET